MSHIIIPRRRPLTLPAARFGVEGFFKIESVRIDKDGTEHRRTLMPWRKNLITDAGMNLPGTLNFNLNACQVGTGAAAPSFSDTTLSNYLAGTSTVQAQTITWVNNDTDTRYIRKRKTFRFGQNVAVGNIAEVGISTAISGGTLWSRALVVDEDGNPTTVTVTPMDFLDVTYELRWHAPIGDINLGVHHIAGSGDHEIVRRVARIGQGTDGNTWGAFPNFSANHGSGTFTHLLSISSGDFVATSATIPGNDLGSWGVHGGWDPYVSNSYKVSRTWVNDITRGNGNIKTVTWSAPCACFQYRFDPVIVKTNEHQLTLQFSISWARL